MTEKFKEIFKKIQIFRNKNSKIPKNFKNFQNFFENSFFHLFAVGGGALYY